MSLPKPVRHVQQLGWGYCLPACAEMALSQLNITQKQTTLARLLETRKGVGTPFSRLERLSKLNVEISEWGGRETLLHSLENGAVIAAIMTTEGLPEWNDIRVPHAVLVISMSDKQAIYHDPALSTGPVTAPRDEFLLAWSYMSEQLACLSPQ